MQYPLILNQYPGNLQLYIPDPLLIKTTYEALYLNNAATLFPFWAKLWPSAMALSLFLEQNLDIINNKRVLELGAGIGLPSFSIANQVADLTITDYADDAVMLMQKNIEFVGCKNIKALIADWNSFPISIYAEVVLLSDTNYAPSDFESLIKLIHDFIHKGATIILATPERITASPFIEKLAFYITQQEFIDVTYNGESASIGLFVLQQN